MRTLLRKRQTGEYYQTLSHWTANPDEAYDFRALTPAIRFATLAHLSDAEVVLGADNDSLTAIPVTCFQTGACVAAMHA